MKIFWLQVLGLLILIFGALFLTANRGIILRGGSPSFSEAQQPVTSDNKKIKILDGQSGDEKVSISIEVADTKDKRAQGLGGRDSLDPNSGMLFVFEKKEQYKFWMKEMKFPLDFIWIDGDKVVDILSNVSAPIPDQSDETLAHLAPVVRIDKVLEVNANFARENNIVVGDKIIFQ